MKKSIKDTYDALAKAYEKEVDHSSPYNTDYERPAMLAEVPGNLNEIRILDAGCAAGWYTAKLLELGAQVSAVDISPEMVKATKKRVGSQVEVVCQDLTESLPWADQTFDLILSSLTLHYIKDWQSALQEFKRVLKPGGSLLFSVHHPFMDFHKFEESEDYFSKQLLTDQWKKQGKTTTVSFYRRPLEDIVNQISQYFVIDRLVEPQPIVAMKEKNKSAFDYLMTNPHFLIIKARRGMK
ncbi:class I SAM-dependent methyltransferase [Radiobacillus sp. PE A8.2]|uniref:class I SAM-dependent methyltransferase n=1 Tax=Radiobacillus sp. PE A8.2 TaxID=3380349 RepID=UPI0038900F28